MSTYAAPGRVTYTVRRVATGGRDLHRRIWRSCIHYVKRSNAWPGPTPEGHAWQNRGPGPQEPHAKRNL